jgi:hypothetical protein
MEEADARMGRLFDPQLADSECLIVRWEMESAILTFDEVERKSWR